MCVYVCVMNYFQYIIRFENHFVPVKVTSYQVQIQLRFVLIDRIGDVPN